VDCTHVVDRGGHNSRRLVADHTRAHDILASESGSAHEDAGRQFGARRFSACSSHGRGNLVDLHQRCNEQSHP
jgi:hypothetical protein